jgi:hypothetical protein
MSDVVYQGADAPESLAIAVTSADYDLATVTAASLRVTLPDGTVTSWTAAVSGATTSALTLTHTFSPAETAQLGIYQVLGLLAVPAGTLRTLQSNFLVQPL